VRSLRLRLLAAIALGTALILGAAGVSIYLTARARLLSQFDGALGQKARVLVGVIDWEGKRADLEFADHPPDEYQPGGRAEYYELWRADGSVLTRSPSLGQGDLPKLGGPTGSLVYGWASLPDGRPGRVAGLRFAPRKAELRRELDPDPEHSFLIVVARETRDLRATLASLRAVLLVVGATAVLLSLAVLAGCVGSGLRPLGELAEQLGRMDENDLRPTLEPADVPAELAPVVLRLNDLLSRLERAFAQQKALTADVAHELRTPLAGLEATLEVALSRDRQPEAYRAAMADCLEICVQSQRIVEHLLCLARLDAGQSTVDRQSVCLRDMLQVCWAPLARQADTRRLEVAWDVDRSLALYTDAPKLRLILSNLLANAVSHADEGGRIGITARAESDGLVLSVENTGSRLSQEEAEHAFERFWRADASRGDTGVHCGLGLSLCRELAALLGASIALHSTVGGAFQVVLAFAAAGQQAGC
jgi:two-component system heavy metal sensor histidine kinase CusS